MLDEPLNSRLQAAGGALVLLSLGFAAPLSAQLTNPLPALADSGLAIEIEEWVTIPASRTAAPKARLSHVKPCPGSTSLFCNDMRGRLWKITGDEDPTTTIFLSMRRYFPRFIDTPGLGAGFSSFAFHPEFATKDAAGLGRFYTAHTETPAGSPAPDFTSPLVSSSTQHGVVTEWFLSRPGVDPLAPGPLKFSRRELLRVAFPIHVHGIQEIAFDPNARPGDDNHGCLFVCIGDGGSAAIGIPRNISRIDAIMGSIIRIVPLLGNQQAESDYLPSANGSYLIPRSNPFAAAPDPTPGDGYDTVKELYAYGFRNPHRISWDPGGTGKMFCGNIGEKNIEEIELIEPGGHYGWPYREGSYLYDRDDSTSVYPLPVPDTAPAGSPHAPAAYSYPVAQFDHGEAFAIIGGYVYRGSEIPELRGMYLCGGIVTGRLFMVPESELVLQPPATSGDSPGTFLKLQLSYQNAATTFLEVLEAPRADLRFGIDHQGELLLLSKRNGTIYRIHSARRNYIPEFQINTEGIRVSATFPTTRGKVYWMWRSFDLKSWWRINASITGDGNPGLLRDPVPRLSQGYFRIEELSP